MTGFTDEISCSLTISRIGSNDRHILIIRNGFDSGVFQGGPLIFSIKNLRNPRTTMETNTFTLEIYDS
jgi:hypothetical protein